MGGLRLFLLLLLLPLLLTLLHSPLRAAAWATGAGAAPPDADTAGAAAYRGTLKSNDAVPQRGGSNAFFHANDQALTSSEAQVAVGASGGGTGPGGAQPTLHKPPKLAFDLGKVDPSARAACPGGVDWLALGLAFGNAGHYPAVSSITLEAPTADGWSDYADASANSDGESVRVEVYGGTTFLGGLKAPVDVRSSTDAMDGVILVRERAQCRSSDTLMGVSGGETLSSCGALCGAEPDCHYFVFGVEGTSASKTCYHEKTTSAACPEGFQNDPKYHFYKLPEPTPLNRGEANTFLVHSQTCPASSTTCTLGPWDPTRAVFLWVFVRRPDSSPPGTRVSVCTVNMRKRPQGDKNSQTSPLLRRIGREEFIPYSFQQQHGRAIDQYDQSNKGQGTDLMFNGVRESDRMHCAEWRASSANIGVTFSKPRTIGQVMVIAPPGRRAYDISDRVHIQLYCGDKIPEGAPSGTSMIQLRSWNNEHESGAFSAYSVPSSSGFMPVCKAVWIYAPAQNDRYGNPVRVQLCEMEVHEIVGNEFGFAWSRSVSGSADIFADYDPYLRGLRGSGIRAAPGDTPSIAHRFRPMSLPFHGGDPAAGALFDWEQIVGTGAGIFPIDMEVAASVATDGGATARDEAGKHVLLFGAVSDPVPAQGMLDDAARGKESLLAFDGDVDTHISYPGAKTLLLGRRHARTMPWTKVRITSPPSRRLLSDPNPALFEIVRVGEHPLTTEAALGGCQDLASPVSCKAACWADSTCNEVFAYDNGRCCMKTSSDLSQGWRIASGGTYLKRMNYPFGKPVDLTIRVKAGRAIDANVAVVLASQKVTLPSSVPPLFVRDTSKSRNYPDSRAYCASLSEMPEYGGYRYALASLTDKSELDDVLSMLPEGEAIIYYLGAKEKWSGVPEWEWEDDNAGTVFPFGSGDGSVWTTTAWNDVQNNRIALEQSSGRINPNYNDGTAVTGTLCRRQLSTAQQEIMLDIMAPGSDALSFDASKVGSIPFRFDEIWIEMKSSDPSMTFTVAEVEFFVRRYEKRSPVYSRLTLSSQNRVNSCGSNSNRNEDMTLADCYAYFKFEHYRGNTGYRNYNQNSGGHAITATNPGVYSTTSAPRGCFVDNNPYQVPTGQDRINYNRHAKANSHNEKYEEQVCKGWAKSVLPDTFLPDDAPEVTAAANFKTNTWTATTSTEGNVTDLTMLPWRSSPISAMQTLSSGPGLFGSVTVEYTMTAPQLMPLLPTCTCNNDSTIGDGTDASKLACEGAFYRPSTGGDGFVVRNGTRFAASDCSSFGSECVDGDVAGAGVNIVLPGGSALGKATACTQAEKYYWPQNAKSDACFASLGSAELFDGSPAQCVHAKRHRPQLFPNDADIRLPENPTRSEADVRVLAGLTAASGDVRCTVYDIRSTQDPAVGAAPCFMGGGFVVEQNLRGNTEDPSWFHQAPAKPEQRFTPPTFRVQSSFNAGVLSASTSNMNQALRTVDASGAVRSSDSIYNVRLHRNGIDGSLDITVNGKTVPNQLSVGLAPLRLWFQSLSIRASVHVRGISIKTRMPQFVQFTYGKLHFHTNEKSRFEAYFDSLQPPSDRRDHLLLVARSPPWRVLDTFKPKDVFNANEVLHCLAVNARKECMLCGDGYYLLRGHCESSCPPWTLPVEPSTKAQQGQQHAGDTASTDDLDNYVAPASAHNVLLSTSICNDVYDNSEPSDFVIPTGSEFYANSVENAPCKAFDNSRSTGFTSISSLSKDKWIGVHFNQSNNVIVSYEIMFHHTDYKPNNWVLEGAFDDDEEVGSSVAYNDRSVKGNTWIVIDDANFFVESALKNNLAPWSQSTLSCGTGCYRYYPYKRFVIPRSQRGTGFSRYRLRFSGRTNRQIRIMKVHFFTEKDELPPSGWYCAGFVDQDSMRARFRGTVTATAPMNGTSPSLFWGKSSTERSDISGRSPVRSFPLPHNGVLQARLPSVTSPADATHLLVVQDNTTVLQSFLLVDRGCNRSLPPGMADCARCSVRKFECKRCMNGKWLDRGLCVAKCTRGFENAVNDVRGRHCVASQISETEQAGTDDDPPASVLTSFLSSSTSLLADLSNSTMCHDGTYLNSADQCRSTCMFGELAVRGNQITTAGGISGGVCLPCSNDSAVGLTSVVVGPDPLIDTVALSVTPRTIVVNGVFRSARTGPLVLDVQSGHPVFLFEAGDNSDTSIHTNLSFNSTVSGGGGTATELCVMTSAHITSAYNLRVTLTSTDVGKSSCMMPHGLKFSLRLNASRCACLAPNPSADHIVRYVVHTRSTAPSPPKNTDEYIVHKNMACDWGSIDKHYLFHDYKTLAECKAECADGATLEGEMCKAVTWGNNEDPDKSRCLEDGTCTCYTCYKHTAGVNMINYTAYHTYVKNIAMYAWRNALSVSCPSSTEATVLRPRPSTQCPVQDGTAAYLDGSSTDKLGKTGLLRKIDLTCHDTSETSPEISRDFVRENGAKDSYTLKGIHNNACFKSDRKYVATDGAVVTLDTHGNNRPETYTLGSLFNGIICQSDNKPVGCMWRSHAHDKHHTLTITFAKPRDIQEIRVTMGYISAHIEYKVSAKVESARSGAPFGVITISNPDYVKNANRYGASLTHDFVSDNRKGIYKANRLKTSEIYIHAKPTQAQGGYVSFDEIEIWETVTPGLRSPADHCTCGVGIGEASCRRGEFCVQQGVIHKSKGEGGQQGSSGGWFAGDNGESCKTVCESLGHECDPDRDTIRSQADMQTIGQATGVYGGQGCGSYQNGGLRTPPAGGMTSWYRTGSSADGSRICYFGTNQDKQNCEALSNNNDGQFCYCRIATTSTPEANSSGCVDTDDGKVGRYSITCATMKLEKCSSHDKDDFIASDMCCMCGGGSSSGSDGDTSDNDDEGMKNGVFCVDQLLTKTSKSLLTSTPRRRPTSTFFLDSNQTCGCGSAAFSMFCSQCENYRCVGTCTPPRCGALPGRGGTRDMLLRLDTLGHRVAAVGTSYQEAAFDEAPCRCDGFGPWMLATASNLASLRLGEAAEFQYMFAETAASSQQNYKSSHTGTDELGVPIGHGADDSLAWWQSPVTDTLVWDWEFGGNDTAIAGEWTHGPRGWSHRIQALSRPDGRPTTDPAAILVRENVECLSSNTLMGVSGGETLSSCGALCAAEPDCHYFVFGVEGTSASKTCYHERTTSAACPEGFQNDPKYHFYELKERAATGTEPPQRFSSDAMGYATKNPGPYDLHTFSCLKDDADDGVPSVSAGVSVVGCSKDKDDANAARILPKPGLHSDSARATVGMEALWHRVGYVDSSYVTRNVTVYVRASMKSLICGKWERCVAGSANAGQERGNNCSAAVCPNPHTGASGPLAAACVCEGKDECAKGEMCTRTGKCVAGCPANGERATERCLCSHPDLSDAVADKDGSGVWCGTGYACDHRSATCALQVCPNADGSAAVRGENGLGCVCTGTKYSEVCLEGSYCMAEALSRWDPNTPLTLCQAQCDAEITTGSMVSTACAQRKALGATPARREAPTPEKSLREVQVGRHLTNITTSDTQVDASGRGDVNKVFLVWSTDHASGVNGGTYFNYDVASASAANGGDPVVNNANYMVTNLRSGKYGQVILWTGANGGSRGDGHGRWDPDRNEGDWRVGDRIVFGRE